jgi:drug/metabolite transporter (DMT)-like permease
MLPSVEGNILRSLFGELLILFAAACWAVGIILMRRVPQISPFLAVRNIFAIGAVPVVLLALIFERPWTHAVSTDSVLALLALGVVCGGLAYGLFLYIVMRAGPTFSSLVGYLVTLFGVLFGIGFMNDPFGANDIIAVVLILAALTVARF